MSSVNRYSPMMPLWRSSSGNFFGENPPPLGTFGKRHAM